MFYILVGRHARPTAWAADWSTQWRHCWLPGNDAGVLLVPSNDTDIQTDIQTDRQTDRQTDTQTDRHAQTDIQTYRQTDRQTDIQTYRHTDTDRHTDRQTRTDIQTHIQPQRHRDTQTDRNTYTQLTWQAPVNYDYKSKYRITTSTLQNLFQILQGMRISCIKLDAVKGEHISFRVELLMCRLC